MDNAQPQQEADLCPPSTTALLPITVSELTATKLTELELVKGKHHCGKVLYGVLCVEPLISDFADDITTVIRDANRNSIAVVTARWLWQPIISQKMVESSLALGVSATIRDPLLVKRTDGTVAIRVTSLAQIIPGGPFISNGEGYLLNRYLPGEAGKVTTMEDLKKIGVEGCAHFIAHDWAASATKFSLCITEAAHSLKTVPTEEKSSYSTKLSSSYCSRATALVQLGYFQDALVDCNRALSMLPTYVKCLLLAGQAAHAIGHFQEASKAFAAALKICHNDAVITECLKASTDALEQSRSGKFDMSDLCLRSASGEVPRCADFVGSVKIGRLDHGIGRRGLLVTENVTAGDLLLAANPLAVIHRKRELGGIDAWEVLERKLAWESFIVEVVHQIATSERHMAQLWTLDETQEMKIPLMSLFTTGIQCGELGTKQLSIHLNRIQGIVKVNAKTMMKGVKCETGEMSSGIWVLPSFVNHSCSPNCKATLVGNTIFLHATVDIVVGEEVTMLYFDGLSKDVAERRSEAETWFFRGFFKCRCERCLLEENLRV